MHAETRRCRDRFPCNSWLGNYAFVCEKTSQKEKGDNDKVMIRRDSISAVAVSFLGESKRDRKKERKICVKMRKTL